MLVDVESGGRGWSSEYHPRDYEFPELYVDGLDSKRSIWVDLDGRKYYVRPVEGLPRYGLEVYEKAIGDVVNVASATVSRDFAVIVPWKGWRALVLRKGTRVFLVEAWGVQVSHAMLEGSKVRPRDVVAYVLTSKGETRSIRPDVEGVIVLILTDFARQPPGYIYVVAHEKDVIWLDKG